MDTDKENDVASTSTNVKNTEDGNDIGVPDLHVKEQELSLGSGFVRNINLRRRWDEAFSDEDSDLESEINNISDKEMEEQMEQADQVQ